MKVGDLTSPPWNDSMPNGLDDGYSMGGLEVIGGRAGKHSSASPISGLVPLST